jgi:catalase-peroxidase
VALKKKNQLPPAKPFQFPLPPPPSSLPNFSNVRSAIRSLLYGPAIPNGFRGDYANDMPYWGANFIHAAFQCAATFRATDHLGGCNVTVFFLLVRFVDSCFFPQGCPHSVASSSRLGV